MKNRHNVVISIMAEDRAGIVAEVTNGIQSLDGNLADLRQSVLCGYFTMILIAEFPAETGVPEIQSTLAKATASTVSVLPHAPESTLSETTDEYILTAVGNDRAGLVAQMSNFCLEHKINILDLASHVDAQNQYTMILQIDLSNLSCLTQFKKELLTFGQSQGLNLVLQHSEIFRATNEI